MAPDSAPVDPRALVPLHRRHDLAPLLVRMRLIAAARWGNGRTIAEYVVPADQALVPYMTLWAHPEHRAHRAYLLIDTPDGQPTAPYGQLVRPT